MANASSQLIKKLTRVLFVIGIAALIAGLLDPLEGSVIIALGGTLIALATNLMHDIYRKIFLVAAIMIVTGVFFLFYLSSLGGFGSNSELSWWWGILILPYPIGWLMFVIYLIIRLVKRKKE